MTLVDDLLETDLDVVATLTTADHTALAPTAPIAGLGHGVSVSHGAVPTGPLVLVEGDGGFDDDLTEAFDAAAHPRAGAGSSTGGQFVAASSGSSSSGEQGKKKPGDDGKKLSSSAAYDAANEWVYGYIDQTSDAKGGATFRAHRHSANVVDIDFVVLYNDGTMSVDRARVTLTGLGPIVGPVHKGHQLASKRVKAPRHLDPAKLKVREAATAAVLNAVNPGGTYDQPRRRAANRRARAAQQRRQGSSGFNAKHPRAPKGSPAGGQFIQAGDSGASAQGAQRRLKGKLTTEAIRAYQARHGLQEDGVIGRQTAHTLLGHKGKLKVGALTAKQSRALAREGKRSRHREASLLADDIGQRALDAARDALEAPPQRDERPGVDRRAVQLAV